MIPDEDGPIDESKFVRTKPTPAQIDAAAKALMDASIDNKDGMRGLARAALTAAAEVGEERGVVRQETHNFAVRYAEKMSKERDEIEAATIERCAQIVENASTKTLAQIAAAIRKLKDEA